MLPLSLTSGVFSEEDGDLSPFFIKFHTLQTPLSRPSPRNDTHVCCLSSHPPFSPCPLRGSCVPHRYSSTRRATTTRSERLLWCISPYPPARPIPLLYFVLACTRQHVAVMGEDERGERDRQRDCFRVLSSGGEQQRLLPVQC